MKISGLSNFLPNDNLPALKGPGGFNDLLGSLINNVNTSQQESNNVTKDFMEGNGVEIHEVMIAGEKAKTNLELLIEIRNKAVDMYKELSRIPV